MNTLQSWQPATAPPCHPLCLVEVGMDEGRPNSSTRLIYPFVHISTRRRIWRLSAMDRVKGRDESSACCSGSSPSFPCLTFLWWGEGGRRLAPSPLTAAFSMSLQSIIWCGDRKVLISVRLKYRYGPGYKLQNVQARGEAINKAISSVITASLSANHLSKIFFWKRYSLPLGLDCEFNGSRTNNIPP